jgi:hypothetical protein
MKMQHFAAIAAYALQSVAHVAFADSKSTTKTLETAPISYFDQNCARCHGPMGSFYGDNFGANLTDAQLKRVVKEMADGPGNAPVDGLDLDAQIAFHRALVKKEPFIAVLEKSGNELRGEVSPGSQVELDMPQPIKAKVTENQWVLTLPNNIQESSGGLKLKARLNGKTIELGWPKKVFSHSRP